MNSTPCADSLRLVALLDGEITQNDASTLRAHLDGCAACRAQLQELEQLVGELRDPIEDATLDPDRVNANVARALLVPKARVPRARLLLRLLAAAVLASGVALVWVRSPNDEFAHNDEHGFTARGTGQRGSARRDVDVKLLVDDGTPLSPGMHVTKSTRYRLSVATLPAKRTYHLFVVGIDAAAELHWLEPVYLDANSPPSSTELAPGRGETHWPRAVAFENPAPGPMALVAVLREVPTTVERVEALPTTERSVAGLSRAFPEAELRSWSITVESER